MNLFGSSRLTRYLSANTKPGAASDHCNIIPLEAYGNIGNLPDSICYFDIFVYLCKRKIHASINASSFFSFLLLELPDGLKDHLLSSKVNSIAGCIALLETS